MYESSIGMFNLWFPMVMFLLPLAIALPVRTKPHPSYSAEEQRQKSQRYTVGLCLGSLMAILVHLGFYSTALPIALKTHTWILFFPLWFLLGDPLLQAKDPGWMSTTKIQGHIRKASLEVRHTEFFAVWRWWVGAAFVWIVLAVVATPFLLNLQGWIKWPPVLFMVGSFFTS